MKIGDRVRFLSDVGGGIVKGFQNNNKVVLVEDEDGFQMPVLASDVVVVTTDDYNIAKVDTMGRHQQSAQKTEEIPKTAELPAAGSQTSHEDDEETDLADKSILLLYLLIQRSSRRQPLKPTLSTIAIIISTIYISRRKTMPSLSARWE